MKVLIIMVLLTSQIYSQTPYELPFSSKGNSIELTVKNSSGIKTEGIEVSASDKPSWLNFKEESKRIEVLKGGEEKAVEFNFSVDKTAPVQKETKLKFKITNSKGESWEKEIAVEVSPPKEFKLYQNYPIRSTRAQRYHIQFQPPKIPLLPKGGIQGGFLLY